MRLLGMVESLSISTQEALGGLDSRLLALEARLQSSLSGGQMLCKSCNALLCMTAQVLLQAVACIDTVHV